LVKDVQGTATVSKMYYKNKNVWFYYESHKHKQTLNCE